MATRTVADQGAQRKREELAEIKEQLATVLDRLVAAEIAWSSEWDGGTAVDAYPSRTDKRLRGTLLEEGRRAQARGYEADRSDCGRGNAPTCGSCGRPMRYVQRESARVDTVLGGVGLAMGRYHCAGCRESVRPRAGQLDLQGAMTPAAREMASTAGSTNIGRIASTPWPHEILPLPKICRTPLPRCPITPNHTTLPNKCIFGSNSR